MSVPPNFADVLKPTNDLLGKDYKTGSALEVNTLTANGVKFTVAGTQDKSGKVFAELKTKYTDAKNGLALTESWSTANLLTAQLEVDNKVASGLKLDLVGTLLPNASGAATKTAKVTAVYKQPNVHARTTVDLTKGPTVNADVVVGKDGVLAGGQIGYDLLDGRLTNNSALVGFKASDYSAALSASNTFSTITAAYYHRIGFDLEVGAKATYDTRATSAPTTLELGSKYFLDATAYAKAKIDNSGRLGLSYTQELRKGAKITLAGLFNTTAAAEDSAKLGLALTFDA
ncbi:hypothetical protein GQ42DRAFT_163922 [Ramicandelaber brevisporus]|nr:hypothetical protein GQ42DRAFT_163922 [Ramicandelaber brevisporus]